jgi:hypothetical protein
MGSPRAYAYLALGAGAFAMYASTVACFAMR